MSMDNSNHYESKKMPPRIPEPTPGALLPIEGRPIGEEEEFGERT